MKFWGLIFFLLLFSGFVQAFEFNGGKIDIPDGFEGPRSKSMGQGAKSIAYIYPHDDDTGTLLQITIWNLGRTFPSVSSEELKVRSEQNLMQFLSGIERRREDFKREQVEFVQISGHPAAKVAWSGKAEGKNIHGIMYCLILNSKIYIFHTQDFSSFKAKYTGQAVNAIEKTEFNR